MNIETYREELTFDDLDLPDSEIFLYMGYKGSEPQEIVVELLHEMKEELKSICKPKWGFQYVPGEIVGKQEIRLDDQVVKPGRIITHSLEGSEAFLIMIATAGLEFNEWLHSPKNQEDVLRVFIADALGSSIAEATVAISLQRIAEKLAPLGLKNSNSYSPGYCGWHVSEQKRIFSLIPERFNDVELTDSCLMLPIKSVSAVIGIGSSIEKKPYGCAICKKVDCYKRRVS